MSFGAAGPFGPNLYRILAVDKVLGAYIPVAPRAAHRGFRIIKAPVVALKVPVPYPEGQKVAK